MSTEFFNDQWRIPSNENQNKVSNYSMDFNGSSDYIDCGDSDKFSFGNGTTDSPFSISAWINMTDATRFRVVNKGSDFLNDYEYLFTTGGSDQLAFNLYDSGARIARKYNTALTSYEGTWIHIVATYDGSSTSNGIKLYLNGSILVTASNDLNPADYTAMENTTNVLEIGAQASESKFANGKIDQVSIFDYELSQDQVTQLGAEGYAFNFIPNDYIDLGTTTAYDTGDLSAAIWVKITDNGTTQYIFSNSGSPAIKGFDIKVRGNNEIGIQRYNTTNGAGSGWISPGFVYDTWQHLAFTYEESTGTIKTFLNGNLVATDTGTSTATLVSEKLTIGSYKGTQAYTNGELSNAVVFNSKLQDSEIATLYNNGKPLADMSSFTSLQGWWKLDDTATFNSGTSVWSIPDDSSNSNTGTSVGMDISNLVASNINGELIANPMATSPKPIAYYQLGDQSVDNGANYLVPNNSLSGYDLKWVRGNSSHSAGDSVNIPGVNKALGGATSMSMTFWVYLTQAVHPNGMMFKMNAGSGYVQVRFFRYGNSRGPVWMFGMGDGTNSSGPSGSSSTATRPNFYNSDFLPSPAGSNMWWNITCTWDGSNVKVYRNGATQSSRWGTYTGIIPSDANATAFLGANKPGTSASVIGGNFLDGRLSNAAFWRNYSLTESEVQEVYNNGAPLNLNNFSGSAPAAWYKLDSSSIFNSTSTEWSVDNNAYPSVYKSSLSFDGQNDYISASGSSLPTGNSSFTASCWFRRNGTQANYAAILSWGTGATREKVIILFAPNGTSLRFGFYGDDLPLGDEVAISDNIWYNVVLTYNGSVAKMYINGTLEASHTLGGALNISSSNPILIGKQSTYEFKGSISNVQIFNTVLPTTGSNSIETLYNNGRPLENMSSFTSLVNWWKLNNTTTGIQDSAGSNNGTNNGATEYAGFVNALAGESANMDSSNLVVSDLQQASGYSPYALDFDGADDYLDAGNDSTLNISGDLTISAWVKINDYNDYHGVVSKIDSSTRNYEILIRPSIPTGGVSFYVGNTTYITSTTVIPLNTWTHIVVAVESGVTNGAKIYINGNQDATTGTLTINPNTANLNIGRRTTGSFYMNGEISNVSIFAAKLSSTEIIEIYNSGVPSNLNNLSGTKPTSWWQLGSNSSFNTNWTCLDEIGTNNAVSANMTNSDIVDGVGYSASGLGTSSIDIKGDAPYSTANGLSENMDVLDRVSGTGNVPG